MLAQICNGMYVRNDNIYLFFNSLGKIPHIISTYHNFRNILSCIYTFAAIKSGVNSISELNYIDKVIHKTYTSIKIVLHLNFEF